MQGNGQLLLQGRARVCRDWDIAKGPRLPIWSMLKGK